MSASAARVRGAMLGLLVGDALGVPYEFHDAADLPSAIEMEPSEWFARSHPHVRPGTWSDDGAQALALLASLLEHPRFDPADFGRRLVSWLDAGELAVDGHVFDVGIQTRIAIDRLRDGVAPLEAGPREEERNGNGSLMRVLPVALALPRASDAELVRIADASSRLTHGHARSRVSCALYVLWARRVLAASNDAWHDAVAALRAIYEAGTEERETLDRVLRPDEPAIGHGTGYVVDTLASARMCIEAHPTYEGAVVAAIRLGGDTDTTACVTGGIAGLREGVDAIPPRWRQALRGKDVAEPLVARLVEVASR